jgi:hypothetical protein
MGIKKEGRNMENLGISYMKVLNQDKGNFDGIIKGEGIEMLTWFSAMNCDLSILILQLIDYKSISKFL